MRRSIIFLVTLLVLVSAIPAAAQRSKPGCIPANAIKRAQAMKSSKDDAKDMAALNLFAEQISSLNIACNGLTFSGEGSKVLNPFDLPKGKYRMKIQGSNLVYTTVRIENATEALCFGLLGMGVSEGAIDASNDCRAILSVESTAALGETSWTVTLEPLK